MGEHFFFLLLLLKAVHHKGSDHKQSTVYISKMETKTKTLDSNQNILP